MLTYTNIKNVPDYEQLKTNIVNMPIERIQKNIKIFDDFLSSNKKFFVAKNKSSRMNRDCTKEFRNFLADAIKSRLPKCVKENETSFVNKILPSTPLTKPKNVSNIGISNETTTNNSNKKENNTMKKNTNTLTTELDNTMLTSNVAQLTDAVNKILVRLDALEAKNVAPKHEFKKLRETAEEVKKETKKVKKVAKVKTANKEQKAEIVKLQKRAQEGKKSLTKKQLAQYTRMWHAKWQEINKTIDINDKAARSLAFAKGRIACLKKARTY